MREMDAFRPMAMFCIRASKKVRHLMFWNAMLCILGNMLLSDDQAQMATMGPITKDILEESVEDAIEDDSNMDNEENDKESMQIYFLLDKISDTIKRKSIYDYVKITVSFL